MIKLENFMKQALNLAQTAYDQNEIPIGAIVVKNRKIIEKPLLVIFGL